MHKNQFDLIKRTFSFAEKISGINDYFQAAVLVSLVLIDDTYHLVFQQRSPQIRQGGEICFPGGKIDSADASPLDAALREVYEEMGCHSDSIEIIGCLDTLILPTGTLIYPYLGILSGTVEEFTLSKEEVAEVFTIPLSYFLDSDPEIYECKVRIHPTEIDANTGEEQILLPVDELGLPAHYRQPWGNASHKIYVYHTDHGPVWGLTARIIYDLIMKIKQFDQKKNSKNSSK